MNTTKYSALYKVIGKIIGTNMPVKYFKYKKTYWNNLWYMYTMYI